MDVVLLTVVTLALGSSVAGALLQRRATRRYRPEGALAQEIVEADVPFDLAFPAGSGGELMLRYFVSGPPRGTSAYARYGLAGTLTLARPDDGGAERSWTEDFAVGWDTLGKRGRRIGATYAVRRMGTNTEATAVLCRVPAGGSLHIRGRITTTPGTEALSLVLFLRGD